MNRRFAEAVIAAFRDDRAYVLRARLSAFSERDWLRGMHWLDTSGLALYLLSRMKALGIERVVPSRVLACLEQNQADNRTRTQDLFDEFVKINMEFQRAGLSYANLKGFTFAPRSYSDPAYRYQHDLDFLVSACDAASARAALERHGYRLSGVCGDTWEFRAGAPEVSSMADLYKPRKQRCLELHCVSDDEESGLHAYDGRLSRTQLQMWNGFEFPALSEPDKFLAQAMHLFKHFQTEWTRTAWLLEYATCIRSHDGDRDFWREVIAAISINPEIRLGVGVATLIATRTFGVTPHPAFAVCTVDELPTPVRLWVDRYEQDVVFVQHPGSKLYLLLRDVLMEGQPAWRSERRRRLLPWRPPQEMVTTGRTDDLRLRARVVFARLRHLWARIRFHAAQGLRYKIEAARWKKLVVESAAGKHL